MQPKNPQLPVRCPSCGEGLHVESLSCEVCSTTVQGRYVLPVLLMLEKEELDFILSFVKKSGSLKEMSKEMGISYPTIRNYLNELIEKLNSLDHGNANNQTRKE